MPKYVNTNFYIAVNGTAYSDHCSNVTVEDAAEEIDFTSFTANSYREFAPGLKDASITATFFQDYAANSVYQALQPIYQTSGTCGIEIRPVNAAVSATNPKGTMLAKIYSFPAMGGAVGDAAQVEVTFRNAGTAGLVMGTA